MPARLARTPADAQLKEVVGSGPFKFVPEEWQPGNRVVYVRNPAYVPRGEPASFGAGGKQVYVDRVEWLSISNPERSVRPWRPGTSIIGKTRRSTLSRSWRKMPISR